MIDKTIIMMLGAMFLFSFVTAGLEISDGAQDGIIVSVPPVPNGGGGGGGNPFNQDLNTYDNVQFNNLIATGNLTDTACFTLEGSFNIGTSGNYWQLGLNTLSSGEGIKMIADGSITQYGWTCSGTIGQDICTFEHEIRLGGSKLVAETWDVQNSVFEYGRDVHNFVADDLVQLYYKRTGSLCQNSGKRSCGGFVCVVYDN